MDNNCDGEVDGNRVDESVVQLPCTLQQLAPYGHGRSCYVRRSSSVLSGEEYHFTELFISSNVHIEVEPNQDTNYEGYIGYSGATSCMKGGGHLKIKTHVLELLGTLSANAEQIESFPENCGGSSGGHIDVHAQRILINGGRIEANGSDGFSYITNEKRPGGGAGGSIHLYAHSIDLINAALIQSKGGQAGQHLSGSFMGMAGGGPGKAGGQDGGGGAGGRGTWNDVGPEDSNRKIKLIGLVNQNDLSAIEALDGNDQYDGYIALGGANRSIYNLYDLLDRTHYPFILHLQDGEHNPSSNVEVSLAPIIDGIINRGDEINLGTTDEDGWLISTPSFEPLDETLSYQVFLDGSDTTGSYFLSYADSSFQIACTLNNQVFVNQTFTFPLNLCQ